MGGDKAPERHTVALQIECDHLPSHKSGDGTIDAQCVLWTKDKLQKDAEWHEHGRTEVLKKTSHPQFTQYIDIIWEPTVSGGQKGHGYDMKLEVRRPPLLAGLAPATWRLAARCCRRCRPCFAAQVTSTQCLRLESSVDLGSGMAGNAGLPP